MSPWRTCAGLLMVAVTLGACAAPPADPAPPEPVSSSGAVSPTPPGAVTPVDAQASVDRLFAAAVAGDRSRWDAGTAALDDASVARASMLFDNLHALRPARLRVRLTGVVQQLPAPRQAELGGAARVVQAQLGWRLPGERADASSTVWLTLVPGPSGERLAGTDDGARLDTPAVPLWWLAPVTRVARGRVTVLVGPGQDAGRWLDLASRAATATRHHLPTTLGRRWDGHLVVEVPGSEADLARVLGSTPAAYATTAAVTRPEGPTTAAAVRVVVNPTISGGSDSELGTTLVHETVHVATRSATSSAPLWAVEGLAEHVALAAHPARRSEEVAPLPAGDPPTRLPADAAFTAGGPEVNAAYAQAWSVCLAVAEHRGPDDLGRFYAALDDGDAVETAARATLGVDDGTVVRWWRRELRRAAADGRG